MSSQVCQIRVEMKSYRLVDLV
uniref:Uncharacterized protein n=1 Tax=Anguilla anguilla TaxID=7936 RepID=A0A0E9VFM0_ANGAN